jgi:hypothetical protein
MAKSKRSAEEVCVEYAIAAESVREQTRIMRNNRREEESKGERGAYGCVEGAQESCLSEHWSIEATPYGERPSRAFEDMCELCQIRLKAFETRRECKRRLGAAKRAVEAIGKRLQAVT